MLPSLSSRLSSRVSSRCHVKQLVITATRKARLKKNNANIFIVLLSIAVRVPPVYTCLHPTRIAHSSRAPASDTPIAPLAALWLSLPVSPPPPLAPPGTMGYTKDDLLARLEVRATTALFAPCLPQVLPPCVYSLGPRRSAGLGLLLLPAGALWL